MAESKNRDYLTIDEISNIGDDGAELPFIDPEDVPPSSGHLEAREHRS